MGYEFHSYREPDFQRGIRRANLAGNNHGEWLIKTMGLVHGEWKSHQSPYYNVYPCVSDMLLNI